MSTNQKNIFNLLILFFILGTNGATGLPYKWYGGSEISMTNSSLDFSKKMRHPDHYYSQRKILSKGNYASNGDEVTSRSDGKIIFPSDDMDGQTQKYTIPMKAACEKSTYCENVQNYPNDIVEAFLRRNKDLQLLSGVDLVPDVVHRVNAPPEDTSLCESQEKVVYPKVAENKDKEWLFVVNHANFTQGVRVETCGKENSDCSLIDGFAEGYKTVCKQKYIYRQLVAVSTFGEFKPEMFRFPASCCCHIKFVGNPLTRVGVTTVTTKKTEPKK